MSYLGNTPTQQNFVAGADQFSGTGSQLAFTLSRNVNTVFDIFVTVSNVPQDPFTAYTISGNTLTFDSAPPAGTNNIDVVYRATNVQTFVPSPGATIQGSFGVAGNLQLAAASSVTKNNIAAYLLKSTTVLTSGTAATYTTPTGVRALKVTALGGGGGGGGQDGQGSGTYTTAGAGRGGNAVSMFIPTASASYTYTIGAGGAGGAAGANAGATGGNTTFGDGTLLITAGGGGAGNGVTGSSSSSGINNASTASTVANGNSSVIYITGTPGVWGRAVSAALTAWSCSGVSPLFGGGVPTQAGAGASATNYGEGGGAGYDGGVTTNYAGGSGFQGIIIIEEYY